MKRFGVPVLALLMGLSLSAFPQYGGQQASTSDQIKTATSTHSGTGKLHHLKDKISDDGKSFTSAKDGKACTIVNPEAVRGHEGHDVILSAHVYPDKNYIHVVSVKMADEKSFKKEKGSAISDRHRIKSHTRQQEKSSLSAKNLTAPFKFRE